MSSLELPGALLVLEVLRESFDMLHRCLQQQDAQSIVDVNATLGELLIEVLVEPPSMCVKVGEDENFLCVFM